MLKSHMISMHLVSFQNNSIFYNSYIKCIEQGVFRIERITFSRYYVENLEKCEIVFKLLASNCIISFEGEEQSSGTCLTINLLDKKIGTEYVPMTFDSSDEDHEVFNSKTSTTQEHDCL